MSDSPRRILLRFAPMIYGPTVLFALGEGAAIPLIPVIASSLGADVATAAVASTALVVGQLAGNLPAGWAVARFGERITMAAAGTIALAALVALALAAHLAVLMAAIFVIGMCAAAFGLARHSFMTTRVPLEFRARALSLLGGTFRLGMFVGPFVAAGLLLWFGDEHAALWFFAATLAAVILLVLFGPDPETVVPVGGGGSDAAPTDAPVDTGEPITGNIPVPGEGRRPGVFRTLWRYRGVLGRLGVAAASLSAMRAARQVVLPLWGVSIGLDAQSIALVVGLSGAIDFALFYASGQVMDRFGRLWAALPAMLVMGAGFLVLAVTHDLANAGLWFVIIGVVLGLGNGLSSGILLTLGADVAPQDDPAPFLGSWRTLTDAGGAFAPLLVSVLTAAVSLPVGAAAVGVIGLLGAVGFIRWVPRFVPRRPRS